MRFSLALQRVLQVTVGFTAAFVCIADGAFQTDTPCVIDADCLFPRGMYCDISTELGQVCRKCRNCEVHNRQPGFNKCIKSVVSDCGPCQHGYFDVVDQDGFRKETCRWRNQEIDSSATGIAYHMAVATAMTLTIVSHYNILCIDYV